MMEKLYTVEEVAELASVTGRTIRNYLKSGRLVGRKIGGQWRFPENEVQRLLSGAEPDDTEAPFSDEERFSDDSAQAFGGDAATAPAQAPSVVPPQAYSPQAGAPAMPAPSGSYESALPAEAAPAYPAPPTGVSAPSQLPTDAYNQPPAASYPAGYAAPAPAQPAPGTTPADASHTQPSGVFAAEASFSAPPYGAPAYAATPYIPQGYPQPAPGGSAAPTDPPAPQGFPVAAAAYPYIPTQQPYAAPPYAPFPAVQAPGATGQPPAAWPQPAPTGYPAHYAGFAPPPGEPAGAPAAAGGAYPAQQVDPPPPAVQAPYTAYQSMGGAFRPPIEDASTKPDDGSNISDFQLGQIKLEKEESSGRAAAGGAAPAPEVSDVARRVLQFISEAHDCSNGPQICTIVDLHQSFNAAKITNERLADIAEQESDDHIKCHYYVEYDERYFVARYTLFGSSAFLLRCLKLIG